MELAKQFQYVQLNRDVPNSDVKAGDRAVVVDFLKQNDRTSEPGYELEVFRDGKTLDVLGVPVSWVTLLPEMWGSVA